MARRSVAFAAPPSPPRAPPAPVRVNSRGHSISLTISDALSHALALLSAHSLKHSLVLSMDEGREAAAAKAASSRGATAVRRRMFRAQTKAEVIESATPRRGSEGNGLEEEPEVVSRTDLRRWRQWALRRAAAAAQLAHPRMMSEEGVLARIPLRTPVPQLADAAGGVATQLYFDLLRLMAGMCALGFVLSLPAIVYSAIYQYASLRASGLLTSADLFGYNSIAVLSLSGRLTCDSALPALVDDASTDVSALCADLQLVNTITCGLEIIYSFFFILVIRAFRRRAQWLAADEFATSRVLVQRYSVRLHGLPKSATPLTIKAHVEAALHNWVDQRITTLRGMAVRRHGTSLEAKYTAQAEALLQLRESGGLQVHDACLILKYGALLRAKIELTPYEKRLDRARHVLAKARARFTHATTRSADAMDYKLESAVHAAERCVGRALRRHDARRSALASRSYELGPCGAFVTFEREEGAQACLEAMRGGLPYLFQPTYLRYPLVGPPAAALEMARAELQADIDAAAKEARESAAAVREGVVAPAVAAVRHQSSPLGRRRFPDANDTPDGESTETKLAALRASAVAANAARDDARESRRLRAFPAPHPQDATFENLPSDLTNFPRTAAWGTLLRRVVARALLLAITVATVSAVMMIHSLKTDVTETAAALLGLNRTTGLDGVQSLTLEQTRQLAQYVSAEQGLGLAVSIALVTFNNLITALVGRVARFERHPTFTRRETIKLLLLTFFVTCNLGLVPLLVGAAIVPASASMGCWVEDVASCLVSDILVCCVTGPKGFLFRGKYLDMEARWYTTVGVLVGTTLVVEFVIGFLWPVFLYLRHRLVRWALVGTRSTLADVVAIFIGPKFDVPRRIARTYAFLSVVLLFSACMPIVYLMGVIYALGHYGIQKWSMLRVCRTPPTYDVQLVASTLVWLKLMVFLHLGIGFWAYGAPMVPGYPLDPHLLASLQVGVQSLANFSGIDDNGATITFGEVLDHAATSWGSAILALATLAVAVFLLSHATYLLLGALLPLGEMAAAINSGCLSCCLACIRRRSYRVDGAASSPRRKARDVRRLSPPLSSAIVGTAHPRLRIWKGRIYSPEMVKRQEADGVCAALCFLAGLNPMRIMFRVCGLTKAQHTISADDWLRAAPLRVKVSAAASVSYEPQFSPWYSHLFFVSEADAEDARRRRSQASMASIEDIESQEHRRSSHVPPPEGSPAHDPAKELSIDSIEESSDSDGELRTPKAPRNLQLPSEGSDGTPLHPRGWSDRPSTKGDRSDRRFDLAVQLPTHGTPPPARLPAPDSSRSQSIDTHAELHRASGLDVDMGVHANADASVEGGADATMDVSSAVRDEEGRLLAVVSL